MLDDPIHSLHERKITFMDSTLRDGEQTPGVVFTPDDKLAIARILDQIGVQSIDAGFAAVSEQERKAIRRIVDEKLRLKIYSLCRSKKEDIDYAVECGVDGVLLFAPTSEVMLKAKFSEDISTVRKKILEMVKESISYAKDKGLYVTFGAEDSTRTNIEYLKEVMAEAVDSGSDMLGFADTVGVMSPHHFYSMMKEIRGAFPNQLLKVHCHNDYGLANINAIAGILAGADEVDVTIGGIGERTGNTSLEEVVMALKHLYHAEIKMDTSLFTPAAQLVQRLSGINLAPNKSLIGQNAFAHESGIHTHAVLNNPLSYEPFSPEEVGNQRRIMFGKHSGKNTVEKVLENNGFLPDENQLQMLFEKIKNHQELLSEPDVIKLFQELK
jgi:isopropylmalate/homocitrate/citramalate synthase